MDADGITSVSATDKMTDVVKVTAGRLENVFVYLKGGAADKNSFPVPSDPAVLDQQGCRYHPRTLGVMTDQKFEVRNSDPTTHNVHPSPKVNPEWNQSQPQGAPPIDQVFKRKEVIIPIKCNQHPWMKANVAVLDHPFFAVSDSAGSFSIKGLPPGEYEIEAWHEKYGAKTMKVKVDAKSDAKADFAYEASSAYTPGTLKVEPAVVVP